MAGILNAELAFPQFPALDQFGQNTTLLLHGDGTNGAQNNTFLDSSANNFTITRNGNTTQGTFSPFSQPNGWWSNYFAGSQSINAPASTDFQFAGDFTIEAWLYPTSTGDRSVIVQNSGSNYLALNVNAGTGFNIYLNSSGPSISPTDIIPQVNQWNHVALVRSGSTVKVYLNGVASGTTATNSSTVGYNLAFYVGALGTQSSGSTIGYISNVRVVNGTAVYTSNFTPPTSPLTAITNTKLLTCQSNRFLDNSSNAFAITTSGTPSVQAFHPISAPTAYYPAVNGGAGDFDGSGDFLVTGTSTNLSLSNSDFTVEYWAYFTSSGNNQTAVSAGNNATYDPIFCYTTGGIIQVYLSASGTSWGLLNGVILASSFSVNTWHHIAITRTGGNVYTFFNGVLTSTTAVTTQTIYQSANSFVVGTSQTSNYFNGYISGFRFLKGTALYTSTFTVPSSPPTAISNTQLLMNYTNAGIIDSVSQNELETVGNAQVSTTQSKFGGASMYFDGSTSYASFLNNPINVLGDFTVEGWFYSASATSSFMGLFGFGAISSSISPVTLILGNATSGPNAASSVNLLVSVDGSNWAINSASASGTTSNNAWIHFAVVRSGGTFTVYLNGNAVITSTAIASTTSLYSGGTINRVGAYGYSGYYYSGYIDDFRVTKGIARYTQNFTPPQNAYPNYGPLTNIPTIDPNFKNTTLLLHGNGTNGAQNNTFLDSSTNNFTITRNGNTTQGTFTPFSQPNGWWSNYFDGSSRLLVAQTTPFNFGTGAFTVECWIYRIGNGSGTGSPYDCVLGGHTGATNTWGLYIYQANNYPSFYVNGSLIEAPIPIQNNTWTHLAAVRDGSGNVGVYVNGALGVSSSNSGSITVGASGLYIAQDAAINDSFYGYISNVRVIKGQAAYASSFTPSTLPLTTTSQGITAANVSLLTCQSNYFKDNSTNSYAVAVASGTPSVQNFYPFFPPLDYSTAAIGGSGYFDGSGDYLSSSVGAIGTGDFTVEYWSYLNVLNAAGQPGYFQISGTSGGLSTTYTAGLLALDNGSLYVNVGGTTIATSHTLVRYQWFHTAIVRSSGTVSVYVNGSLVSTPTSITTNLTGTYIALGGYYSTGYLMTGYLSGFRVLVGTALYTSTFVPPTLPPTAIANTSFLANFTNGGIFDNASKNDLETVGNAQISTTQSKFGGASMYFDGTGDYLLAPSTTNWDFGTGDFTVEFWVYFSSVTTCSFIGKWGSGAGKYAWITQYITSTSNLTFYTGNNGSLGSAYNFSWSPSTGIWYHVAFTRSGSSLRAYINGNQIGTTQTNSDSLTASGAFCCIGENLDGGGQSQFVNGYIDDLRITKGIARYLYNFTPPAAQFPNK